MSEEKVSLSNPPQVPADRVSPPQNQEQRNEVPTDVVPLPSHGLTYPAESPLHMESGIEIRSMTAREEDILTSKALLKSGRAISMLLRNCIVNKSIDVDRMLIGDRNAALIGIRITGYGREYRVPLECPACGDKTEKSIDLSSLSIKPFPEGISPRSPGVNEFDFVLPNSKKRIVFKLLTGDDEREFMQIIEKKRKEGIAEEAVTTRHKMQILAIDGETNPSKLSNLINNMTAGDSRYLRNYIDRISPGVDMKLPFTCTVCEFSDGEVEVPIGADFFWPTT